MSPRKKTIHTNPEARSPSQPIATAGTVKNPFAGSLKFTLQGQKKENRLFARNRGSKEADEQKEKTERAHENHKDKKLLARLREVSRAPMGTYQPTSRNP